MIVNSVYLANLLRKASGAQLIRALPMARLSCMRELTRVFDSSAPASDAISAPSSQLQIGADCAWILLTASLLSDGLEGRVPSV